MWGYTSYRKTGWCDARGAKMYRANFMSEQLVEKQSGKSIFSYTKCAVDFVAQRPILALHKIIEACNVEGVNPWDFEGIVVN